MSNTFFKFKQFTINQDETAMKVGVDGVLLGAWANPREAKTILDIGAGTGLLSLMLAQKCEASIHSIEIDLDSYRQAQSNIDISLWKNRVSIENISFQDYCKRSQSTFDFIICNPPYFVKSLKSDNSQRNTARHNDSLPLNILFKGVSKLLVENGSFALIYPFDQIEFLKKEALKNQLYVSNLLIVSGTEKKEPNRVIVEYSKQNKTCLSNELIVRDYQTNDYTNAYKEITRDYYLAF